MLRTAISAWTASAWLLPPKAREPNPRNPDWIQNYNRIAPHAALGFLSPKEFRAQQYTELRV